MQLCLSFDAVGNWTNQSLQFNSYRGFHNCKLFVQVLVVKVIENLSPIKMKSNASAGEVKVKC